MISIPKIKEPPTTCTRYEGIHQLCVNINTAGPSAQHRCTPMPGQGATTGQRAVLLRLITPDGAVIESLTSSARSGNGAAMSATSGEEAQ